MKLQVNESEYDIEILEGKAIVNGKEVDLVIGQEDNISLGGKQFVLDFFQEGDPSLMIINGMVYLVSRADQSETLGAKELKAPMSGQLVQVAVTQGAEVKKGQLLLVLEAMKMENQIRSPVSGRILQIRVSKGQHIRLGDIMLVFE